MSKRGGQQSGGGGFKVGIGLIQDGLLLVSCKFKEVAVSFVELRLVSLGFVLGLGLAGLAVDGLFFWKAA